MTVRTRSFCLGSILGLLALVLAISPSLAENAPSTTSHEVKKTFNDAPFAYEMKHMRSTPEFDVYRLTYPSPEVTSHAPNNTIPADYYVPKGIEPGDAKRPGVVCLHILNGRFELVEMLCSGLARGGVPAIMIKLPYYGERAKPDGFKEFERKPSMILDAFSQGRMDVRRTFDVLASRPEIDPDRIGITGISLGAMVSCSTAGIDPRFYRVASILGGGDLLSIIYSSNEARDVREWLKSLSAGDRKKVEDGVRTVDPLGTAEGLKARAAAGRVLMINGTADRVIPKACSDKLAAALGIPDEVMWLDGLGHYTAMAALPRILDAVVAFFAEDLPEGVEPPAPSAAPEDAHQAIAGICKDLFTVLTAEPEKGRCHTVDVEVLSDDDKIPVRGRVRFTRGHGNRFLLKIDLEKPEKITAELGQREYPWLASNKGTLFVGDQEPSDDSASPLECADKDALLKIQVASGALTGIVFAPSLLDRWADWKLETDDDGIQTVVGTLKKPEGSVRLKLGKDSRRPEELAVDIAGIKGRVLFHGWVTNSLALGDILSPNPDYKVKHVRQEDLYRMFGAIFNFAMENIR